MADLEILTTNAASNGWIDNIPGAVATGYQAQNTNITARSLGSDLTTVELTATAVVVKGTSGSVDVAGVPFSMLADKTFLFSAISDGASWIEIIDTANPLEKDLQLLTIAPTWDDALQYWKSGAGRRVLNWVITKDDGAVQVRRMTAAPDLDTSAGVSGIGAGGRRYFETAGSYSVTIARSGLYSVWAIAGGEANGASSGGAGGSCGRADIRLTAGSVIDFVVGAANANSTATITGRLTITATPGTTAAVVTVTGDAAEAEGEYSGGASEWYQDTGAMDWHVANGGGAGPFADGDAGVISLVIDGGGGARYVQHAESQFGSFGTGADGTGFAAVEWLGE